MSPLKAIGEEPSSSQFLLIVDNLSFSWIAKESFQSSLSSDSPHVSRYLLNKYTHHWVKGFCFFWIIFSRILLPSESYSQVLEEKISINHLQENKLQWSEWILLSKRTSTWPTSTEENNTIWLATRKQNHLMIWLRNIRLQRQKIQSMDEEMATQGKLHMLLVWLKMLSEPLMNLVSVVH